MNYDFFLVRGACGVSPIIIDTDAAVRWVSPFNTDLIIGSSSTFFDNAICDAHSSLYRVDLDGAVTALADYGSINVSQFHYRRQRLCRLASAYLAGDGNSNHFFDSSPRIYLMARIS
ncbi:MAG: hypothetical protein ABI233_06770 [Chthoniobacterales bacterium]